jgi:hypothetical protein
MLCCHTCGVCACVWQRLHRVFNNPLLRAVKITNAELMAWLLPFAGFDLTVLSVWAGAFPFGVKTEEQVCDYHTTSVCNALIVCVVGCPQLEVVNEAPVYTSYLCLNQYDLVFNSILATSKTALLIAGVYITYSVRRVPSYFNESRVRPPFFPLTLPFVVCRLTPPCPCFVVPGFDVL